MSTDRFDTIVVGARCAGAPLAIALSRAGQKVLLLDADKLPSDQPLSTHYIQALGVDWLDELGVGARVRELSPPSRRPRLQMGEAKFEIPYQHGRAAHCIRRSTLDPLLQDAAVASGAELRSETKVVGLLREGERVTGVEAEHRGEKHAIAADVVVGADGRHSSVAKLVGAKEYFGYDNVRFGYWGYWPVPKAWHDDPELAGCDALISFDRDRSLRFVFQCDGDLLLIGTTPPIEELDAWSGDFEGRYLKSLQGCGPIEKLVAGNRREGKLVGLKKLRFFFREAAGAGWALVGDAGLHKDPTPGVGITDALRDARSLCSAILEGGDAALRRYHRKRDVDSFDIFHFAKQLGDPSYVNPLNELVYSRVAGRPDLIARMAKTSDREISPFGAIPARDVVGWTFRALLRGRLSLLPAFLRTGKANGTLEPLREQVNARWAAEGAAGVAR